MGHNSVPPRWEEYSNIGKRIPGTRIIPFKVPLRKEICRNLRNSSLSFTVEDLVDQCKDIKLSMVIDLTQTKRFYNGEDLKKFNIKHVKLSTRGGGVMPSEYEVKNFCDVIDKHLEEYPDTIVGVHCTHGLNRTGYFICRYMIDRLGFIGSESVELFEKCRGHEFDRENYRDSLRNITNKETNLKMDLSNKIKYKNQSGNQLSDQYRNRNSPFVFNNDTKCSSYESNNRKKIYSGDKSPSRSPASPRKRYYEDKRDYIYHNNNRQKSSLVYNDNCLYDRESFDNKNNYPDYQSYRASRVKLTSYDKNQKREDREPGKNIHRSNKS